MTKLNDLIRAYDDQIDAETERTWRQDDYWQPLFYTNESDVFSCHCDKVRKKATGRSARVLRRLMDIEINREMGRF